VVDILEARCMPVTKPAPTRVEVESNSRVFWPTRVSTRRLAQHYPLEIPIFLVHSSRHLVLDTAFGHLAIGIILSVTRETHLNQRY